MHYQTATTRQILKALREVGLSARSGCHPCSTKQEDHLDAEVLEAVVVNVCPYRQIGYGCWQHPQLDSVLEELSSRASAALKLINCEFRHIRHANGRPSGQFFVNGYKKA